LQEDRKRLEKELVAARKKAATGGGGAKAETIGDIAFTGAVMEGLPAKELRGLIADALKASEKAVAAFVAVNDGKASVSIGVSPAITSRISAPDLVKAAVETLGGQGGGGKPDLAHGGGPNAHKAEDALAAVKARLSA
jgi:alanyl-tRNA synthetase